MNEVNMSGCCEVLVQSKITFIDDLEETEAACKKKIILNKYSGHLEK